ncbi:MAG: hypothetical protein ACK4YM_11390 [Novosphingobium sp.]
MNDQPKYEVPSGQLALSGPVVRPDHSSLPIRGDIAHIALADRYLVAAYVVPIEQTLVAPCLLHTQPRDDAEAVGTLEAGTRFEVLDIAGNWAWGCIGPEGPTGYLPLAALEA